MYFIVKWLKNTRFCNFPFFHYSLVYHTASYQQRLLLNRHPSRVQNFWDTKNTEYTCFYFVLVTHFVSNNGVVSAVSVFSHPLIKPAKLSLARVSSPNKAMHERERFKEVLQICKRPPTSIGITNSVNLIVHLSNHHSNFKTILLLIRKSFSSNHNPVCSVSMIFHRAS